MVEAVLVEYDVSRELAEKDVNRFLEELLAPGLVERVDGRHVV